MSPRTWLGVMSIWLLLGGGAMASKAFHEPIKGNQYVATTDKYLYVVWSVPKNLAPIGHLKSDGDLDAFIARTAISLCAQHRSALKGASKPCKMQMVKMNTNDEYTKSAAGGFKTVAKLVLPLEHASKATLQRALTMPLAELKALFTSFQVKHDRLTPRGTP